MNRALTKDIIRTIRKGKKRFFSIMLITALGVTMLTGLKAACVDLRYSADALFDEQKLFDIQITSTLGLDENDIDALSTLSDVSSVEGEYSKTVSTDVSGVHEDVMLRTIGSKMNLPTVVKGTLPQAANEIAVTQEYLHDTGKSIGDTISISEGEEDSALKNTEYTITAQVLDPFDSNNKDGHVSFRSSASAAYTFFVSFDAIDSDFYTAVYVRVKDAEKLMCYTDEYTDKIDAVQQKIDSDIKETQQQMRYDTVYGDILEAYKYSEELGLQTLDDAQQEIDDIKVPKWYIQDRASLSGYFNVESDATSIEGLASFLPVVFLALAILISLTTITRMVEEERGLIGTYKALGFTDSEIRRKYIIYAAEASVVGGILGDVCGFVILPEILFIFFRIMYTIPEYLLHFQLVAGLQGIVLFTIGVLLAVWFAVKSELKQVPAALMRPVVPKNGSRIFLERISPLWKKMSFLNKVTARNIFRYKKRLLMTVIGIMGCTALLVCGFAIKDTITELMHLQYENVDRYNIMAIAQSDDNDKLLSYMDDTENIEAYINVEINSVKIRNADGDEQSVQMIVIPDGSDISEFVKLADVSGREIALSEDGVMMTHSASDVLGVYEGDEIEVQDLALNTGIFPVSAVTEYYLGNMIFVSQSCYESVFEEVYMPNAVLVNLTESCKSKDPIAYSEKLGRQDGVISTVSVDSLKAEFSQSFKLINLVVYVILILAGALAFVVLFTLSTTNISERLRELATIKVLGFYDYEVHLYVNKETMLLSLLGIAFGLPVGRALSSCLTWALKIPGLYFAVNVHKVSYVICATIAFLFTVIVNMITNRMLNVIDPVEALKSVE